MNFQQLRDKVYIETVRPDLIDETTNSLLGAISYLHGIDYFFRDIRSAYMLFDSAAYLQTIDTRVMPRYRSIYSVRKWDPSFSTYQQDQSTLPPLYNNQLGIPVNPQYALRLLDWIEPDDIFDEYHMEKVDVAYQVGDTIMIKSSTKVPQAVLHWYEWPFLDEGNDYTGYNDWIADQFPWAIIYKATSALLSTIGQDDMARKYDAVPDPRTGKGGGLVWSHINNLLLSNITAKGR